MQTSILLLALASVATLSCGSSHNKSAAPDGTEAVPTEPRLVVGAWKSGCAKVEDDDLHNKSRLYVYTFAADNQLKVKETGFADDACKTPTTLAETTATYLTGAALATPKGAVQLDIKNQEVTLSLLDAANDSIPDLCSSTEGIKLKPLAPVHCKAGGDVYQIVQVDGKVLYLGSTDDDDATSDAAHRPTQLEKNFGYTAAN